MDLKYNCAFSQIRGGTIYPNIKGTVYFCDSSEGCNIYIMIDGLPQFKQATATTPQIGPHGFHIHQFPVTQNGRLDPTFQSSGEHWNPNNQPHPNHPGDFPVLFSNNGKALMYFFTNRFKVKDIIGKSIVIHESPDDYRTQPSGNSGRKIAGGDIVACMYNYCNFFI